MFCFIIFIFYIYPLPKIVIRRIQNQPLTVTPSFLLLSVGNTIKDVNDFLMLFNSLHLILNAKYSLLNKKYSFLLHFDSILNFLHFDSFKLLRKRTVVIRICHFRNSNHVNFFPYPDAIVFVKKYF